VKKRQEERHARWDAEWKADDRRWALDRKANRATDKIVKLARELIDGANAGWIREKMEAKIKKLDAALNKLAETE
jgi:HAMP domain-containing protein